MNREIKETNELAYLVATAIVSDKTAQETAEYLYKKGYRKQSDTIKEFADDLIEWLKERYENAEVLFNEFKGTNAAITFSGEAVGYDKAISIIKILANEYGVE